MESCESWWRRIHGRRRCWRRICSMRDFGKSGRSCVLHWYVRKGHGEMLDWFELGLESRGPKVGKGRTCWMDIGASTTDEKKDMFQILLVVLVRKPCEEYQLSWVWPIFCSVYIEHDHSSHHVILSCSDLLHFLVIPLFMCKQLQLNFHLSTR